MTTPSSTPDFATALHFTTEMVAANRAGRLHPEQLARLRAQAHNQIFRALLFAAPLLGIAVLLAFSPFPGVIPIIWCLASWSVLALIGYGWTIYKRYRETTRAHIITYSGPIRKERREVDQGTRHPRRVEVSYSFHIQNKSFPLSYAAYMALPEGSYLVYCLASTGEVLSLEPLV